MPNQKENILTKIPTYIPTYNPILESDQTD